MQSQSTLWRLNFFVRDALEVQSKNSESMDGDENPNNKRKKELCDAIATVSKKKTKKPTWRSFGDNILLLGCLELVMIANHLVWWRHPYVKHSFFLRWLIFAFKEILEM